MSTPKYLPNLALVLLLMFAVLPAKAQTVYPVRTIATLTGTMPLSLDGFVSHEGKLQVHVIVDDAAIDNHAVRLRLTMQSSDVRLTTSPNYKPQPIYLNGGAMQLLTATDLAELFNPNNLVFEGITKAQYNKTGRLPEGVYRVTVDVLDYYRNVPISRSTAAIGMVYLTKAPLLTFPTDNSEIDIATSPQIRFSWMTYHAANPEAEVVHKFRLWEVKPATRNAYEVTTVMQPMYEQEATGTSLLLSPNDPLLTQGATYVWQVQAMDANNKVVYQNNGKSQAMVFRYGKSCETPRPRIVKLHTTGGQIAWNGDLSTQQYRIDYRLAGATEWTTDIATQPTYDFKELTDNTTYECTVTALCSGEESDPSNVLQFKTNRTVDYTCGANAVNFDLRNTEPLPALYRFAEFKAGDFTIEVDNVTGSNGLFTGDGYALVPYLGFMKMRVTFDNITVNTDRRMIAGKVEFVYDEATGMVFSLYKTDPKTPEELANGFLEDGVTQIVTTTQPVTSVTVNGTTVTITLADGTTQQVTAAKKGDTVAILSPNAQSAYVADTGSGMVFSTPLPGPGEATNSSAVATPAQSGVYGCGATLTPSSIQHGGFDAVGNGKTKPNNYFRLSKTGQPVAWKSIPAGGTDYVDVNVQGNCDIDSLRYLRESGLPVPSAPSGKGKRLLLAGTTHGHEETLTVALSTKELQRDSTYRQTLTEAGALGLVSYDPKVCNLRLVSVGGAQIPDSAAVIKTELDKLFAPALVSWNVAIEKPLTVDSITPDGFSTTGLGLARSYTDDMDKVIDAYKKTKSLPHNTYVLFFVKANNADKLGYMPLARNYGFIFNLGSDVELLAHELSHGAFNLRHTFDKKSFWKEFGPAPTFPEKTTQNLMDYTNGVELWKYQWDLIHNPETIVLESFNEEAGAYYYKDPEDIWSHNLNQIICDKLRGRTSTVIEGMVSVMNIPALTFNGIENIQISIPGYITGNNDNSIDISSPQVLLSDDKSLCSVRFPINGTEQKLVIKISAAKSKVLVDLFTDPSDTYFTKLVEAIPTQESQDVYKKLVQLPDCGYSQISAQNALRYLGWIAGEFYVNDPQEEIVVNLLRYVRDRKGLYAGLYGNPYLVGKLFSACDGDNRQAFVNEIIKLCDENWTSPTSAQGTIFVGRVPNSFPQFYTGMEFITHCLVKEGRPTCGVRNYIGRFPNGAFDWGYVQDFGATLLKKELNPLDPVRIINSGKEEESLFPVIYPTYLSQEKGNTELTGQFTATLNYIGVTSAIGIIGNGSRLVQTLAWTDVVKTGLDALFNNPRVVASLNNTSDGREFLYFWQIASVTIDVATISASVLEGIVKRGASASSSLKAAGQTEAANKVERLTLEAKKVLAKTGSKVLNVSEIKGLAGVMPTGSKLTNLSFSKFTKGFDADFISSLGSKYADDLAKIKQGLDKGGDLTEGIVSEALRKEGYTVTKDIGKYGSNNGFDVVAYKGTLDNPTEILIIEGKQFKQNQILDEFDDVKTLQGYDEASGLTINSANLETGLPTQMSKKWTFEHVAGKLEDKGGDFLKLSVALENKNIVQRFIFAIDKSDGAGYFTKLSNDF